MAFAQLAEYAVTAAKVAVAADSAVGALLAFIAKYLVGQVNTAKACLFCVACQHTAVVGKVWGTLAWGRPVVLPPVARCNTQLEHGAVSLVRYNLILSAVAAALGLALRAAASGCEAERATLTND
eukprot:scaffold7990_cov72-Phaeocystis_antarctica.AAC.3